jgi:prepilin-type N-terminal cleavage/methylation domain-containing protein
MINSTQPRTSTGLRLRHQQTGFSLIEISVAVALGAMVSIGYLYNQSKDTQLNTAKAQAGYFLVVNDAVGKYMQTYYDELKTIPVECASVRLSAGNTPTPLSNTVNCKFTSGSASSPVNGLQPTLSDLKNLGQLDNNFQDGFLWTTDNVVNSPDSSCTSSSCTTTPHAVVSGYVTRIQRWCGGVLMVDNTSACSSVQLKSLTFNSQPFSSTDTAGFFKLSRQEQLSTAVNAMGGDGLMSLETAIDPSGQGKLYGLGNKTSQDNPITYVDATKVSLNGKGIPGILAVQNGAEIRCSAQ